MTLLLEQPTSQMPAVDQQPDRQSDALVVDLSQYDSFTNRKRWTRADCEFLERVGILSGSYELLDGEVILQLGHNRPHILVTTRAMLWLAGVYGNDRVQSQADVEVGADDQALNRPQPDAAVLKRPDFEFVDPPTGNDLLLVVEVSDTTLRDDLVEKSALYARAGVPEYWVIDVKGRQVYVHQNPEDGSYTSVAAYAMSDELTTGSASQTIRVADLFPPTPAE